MSTENSKDSDGGFCTDCGYRVDSFSELNAEHCSNCKLDLKHCPNCSSDTIPCADVNQVDVNINWHELHIILVWAEHHARAIERNQTVYAIADRLQSQHPARDVLTLAGELREVKDHFGDENVVISDPKLTHDVDSFRRKSKPPKATT